MQDLLTDDERMLQESVRRFMLQEVEPLVPQMEADGYPPRALIKKLGDQGFLGAGFEEEYGGSGGSLAMRAIVSEETARVDGGLDLTLFADIMLFARAISRHGTTEQKEKYLRSTLAGDTIGGMGITEPSGGSNALNPATKAWRDGDDWILNGAKTYVTNAPWGDFLVIIARTSEEPSRIDGGTWFIVERGMEGFATGPAFEKMGMRSSPTGDVFLDHVRVPQRNVLGEVGRGFHYLVDSLDTERVLVGASTVGLIQGCLDEAAAYANERQVFGSPIRNFQLIQEKIAKMAVGIELSRTMLYRLLRAVDRGEKVTREAAILKLYSSEMVSQAASDASQIWGGAGQLETNRVARLFRNSKHHEVGGGTTEIMKVLIARETFKELGYVR